MIASALVVGCTASAPEEAAARRPVSGLELDPVLDEASGAVVLPYDRFVESFGEMDLIAVAGTVLISACAKENGVTFVAPGLSSEPEVYDSELYFGPWTVAQAERFGFVQPMTAADLDANGILSEGSSEADAAGVPDTRNESLADADWAVVDECAGSPDVAALGAGLTHDGPWVAQIRATADAVLEQPATRQLFDELGACYESAGLSPDSEHPWVVDGARTDRITEEQIGLALEVVACKDQIDFTSRMVQIEADLQAPIIVEYADELVAARTALDAAVTQAREVLQENQDLIQQAP